MSRDFGMFRYLYVFAAILMALFVAAACNDDENGTADPVDCHTLGVDECAAQDACVGISGAPIDLEQECHLESEVVACVADDQVCMGVLTLAEDPGGVLWSFPSSCIPTGWTSNDDAETQHLVNAGLCSDDHTPVDCTARSVAECEANEACALLHGRPVDEDNICLETLEPVACDERDLACDDAMTVARDEDSALWVFSSGCIPETWRMESGAEYSQYASAGLCSDDQTPIDCTARSVAECETDDACSHINASKIDEDRDPVCRGEMEPVGCMASERMCGDVMTLARDASNTAWYFSNNCTPDGWTTFEDGRYLDASMCE